MAEHGCNTRIRADTYFAFMTQVHHSSSIPMPSLSYLKKESACNSRAHTKFLPLWCGHVEGSVAGEPWEPIFSTDVHFIAFYPGGSNPAQRSCKLVLIAGPRAGLLFGSGGLCARLRTPLRRTKMIFDYSLAAVVAAGLLCYLIYALLRPERF